MLNRYVLLLLTLLTHSASYSCDEASMVTPDFMQKTKSRLQHILEENGINLPASMRPQAIEFEFIFRESVLVNNNSFISNKIIYFEGTIKNFDGDLESKDKNLIKAPVVWFGGNISRDKIDAIIYADLLITGNKICNADQPFHFYKQTLSDYFDPRGNENDSLECMNPEMTFSQTNKDKLQSILTQHNQALPKSLGSSQIDYGTVFKDKLLINDSVISAKNLIYFKGPVQNYRRHPKREGHIVAPIVWFEKNTSLKEIGGKVYTDLLIIGSQICQPEYCLSFFETSGTEDFAKYMLGSSSFFYPEEIKSHNALLYQSAIELRKNKDYLKAYDKFLSLITASESVEDNMTIIKSYHNIGMILYHNHLYDKALERFKVANIVHKKLFSAPFSPSENNIARLERKLLCLSSAERNTPHSNDAQMIDKLENQQGINILLSKIS